ncbi:MULTISPECIES: hypothetical protein [unclassified Lysobacter]|uniref:hypothetical protein n=1 Tax=unclassified Lysobacter TaxID=2635362 RepID=UPI001BE66ADF|nr:MULTISPECIES: hypothetical protein [unclassified Lysobacter]MBT2747730.1 hypothetical protein [Lysobacter sp. ISL-42]MBT2754048.1 hypothetical protein [Lysobacter sp. ISL-50]MBT2779673.1 hypothetical protein [Lysobacter sp. ISL-54]MBT2780148.1 hypothetical protein [Lysobacter sp. ISL-52]
MDLETIGAVFQTDDVQEVNKRLEDSWVIIAVATGTRADGQPWILYSLGEQYEDEEDEEDEEEGDEEEEEEDSE